MVLSSILTAAHATLPHPHFALAMDNTPALAWVSKGSTTSDKAAAFLLHQLAQLHCAQPYTLTPLFTPGTSNLLAYCCSCSFHLCHESFLTCISEHFRPCTNS